MLNHTTVMGRLVKDPELRQTQGGVSVASFTLAVDRDRSSGKQKTVDFFDCVAWRATAEFVMKYFFKGKMAIVTGPMQSRQYEDRSGVKRTGWEINVENIYFGDDKRREGGWAQMDGGQQQEYQAEAQSSYAALQDDGDLPF